MSLNTDLNTFLYHLHFNIEELSPPDWEVNWTDASLPYKLYRHLPAVPLCSEVPLTLERKNKPVSPNLQAIGHFLWYAYGLTQLSQSVMEAPGQETALTQMVRRFAPSGGALYPNEIYVYLKIKDLAEGVYHYDVAHHRLVMLREGDFDSYLTRALGLHSGISDCFATVFVSTMFWKNFFKYNHFAYRLQGLDTGVLIGQLLEVTKRFGYETNVHVQFLDRAVNHLLGISEHEESVYAVIPLSVERKSTSERAEGKVIQATELCRELPSLQHDHFVRSRKVLEYPMLLKMNEASMLDSTEAFYRLETRESERDWKKGMDREKGRRGGSGRERDRERGAAGQRVELPPVQRLTYDLALACRKRYSPGIDFMMGRVSQIQLAILLREMTPAFFDGADVMYDVDELQDNSESRLSLYLCLNHVEGIPDGAYEYDPDTHTLQLVRSGDQRRQLHQATSPGHLNLFQVPLCLHVVGERSHTVNKQGYRGYRIQQMKAGQLVQRLLLVAAALGMGGHPLLGFDATRCDELYHLAAQDQTCLIQIPIGPCRPHPWLRGELRS